MTIRRRVEEPESRVDERVDQPARADQRPSSQSIGQIAANDRRHHFDDVKPGPQQRNPDRRDAEVVQAQQQERIARVAEAEDQDDGESRE